MYSNLYSVGTKAEWEEYPWDGNCGQFLILQVLADLGPDFNSFEHFLQAAGRTIAGHNPLQKSCLMERYVEPMRFFNE